jgi:spore germination protein KC
VVRVTALVCLLAALLTFGCNGSRETDEISYVITVGIDAAPEGNLYVTYRLAKPSALGGEAGKGGADMASEVITFTAPSLAVARDLLNSQVARAPSLSHAKVFVIGEELARKGIMDVIGPLLRFREFRGSIFIFVADGTTAEKIIRTNKPIIEKLPARWIEGMMASSSESGYYTHSFLHDFYIRLKAGSGSPYAVLIGINPLSGKTRPAAEAVPGEKTEEYLAAGIGQQSGNPVLMMGTALFRGDKLAGKLTSEETRMLGMFVGEFRRGFITIADPVAPQSGVNIHLRPGRKPKVDVNITREGRLVINVDVMVEGEVTAIASGVNYEAPEYNRLLEDNLAAVIRQDMTKMIVYTQQVGCDPVDFGRFIRSQFTTYKEYRDFDFDSKYPQAEVNVQVTAQIRRTGLMRMTTPIRVRQ